MVETLAGSVEAVIGYVGSFVDALVNTEGALNGLMPLVCLGVGVTAVSFGVKIVKSFVWGV